MRIDSKTQLSEEHLVPLEFTQEKYPSYYGYFVIQLVEPVFGFPIYLMLKTSIFGHSRLLSSLLAIFSHSLVKQELKKAIQKIETGSAEAPRGLCIFVDSIFPTPTVSLRWTTLNEDTTFSEIRLSCTSFDMSAVFDSEEELASEVSKLAPILFHPAWANA